MIDSWGNQPRRESLLPQCDEASAVSVDHPLFLQRGWMAGRHRLRGPERFLLCVEQLVPRNPDRAMGLCIPEGRQSGVHPAIARSEIVGRTAVAAPRRSVLLPLLQHNSLMFPMWTYLKLRGPLLQRAGPPGPTCL